MLEYWSSGSRCRGGSTGAGWRQPDPDRRWEPGRGVGLEAPGQPEELGVQDGVLDPGQHPGGVVDGVVVVEDAAGVGQQLPQGDAVPEGQQPRQPALDRVVQAELALLGQLQDQHGRPDLADALQPHAGVGRHGLAGGHIGHAGRPRPAPMGSGDVGGRAGGDACAAAGQLVEHPLQLRAANHRRLVGTHADQGDRGRDGGHEHRHGHQDPRRVPAGSSGAGVGPSGGCGDGRHGDLLSAASGHSDAAIHLDRAAHAGEDPEPKDPRSPGTSPSAQASRSAVTNQQSAADSPALHAAADADSRLPREVAR
jgi:hypothetical protein